MPCYLYEDPDGWIVERVMTVAEMEEKSRDDDSIVEDGVVLIRRIDVEHGGYKHVECSNWPKKCEASAVHPSQVKAMEKRMAELGCETRFTPSGEAIYTSARHRTESLRLRGMYDKSGGYSETHSRLH